MKVFESFIGVAICISSMVLISLTTFMLVFGSASVGMMISSAIFGTDERQLFSLFESQQISWTKIVAATLFLVFAYRAILYLGMKFIDSSHLKVAGGILLFFFLFFNFPSKAFELFFATKTSWFFYLVSLGILTYTWRERRLDTSEMAFNPVKSLDRQEERGGDFPLDSISTP